jgi:hypothetical protein
VGNLPSIDNLENKRIRGVFNTHHPAAVASYHYRRAFSSLDWLVFDDRDHYERYDVALFMTYAEDLEELKHVKQSFPGLKIGLVDPRGSQINPYIDYIDFFIIDSLEMEDYFSQYNIPMLTYYEYPLVPDQERIHTDLQSNKIIIGYHGNKLHLMGMYPNLTTALEGLSRTYDVEFWAMYNVQELGLWKIGVPRNVGVKHIQWSEDNYERYLARVDIGIVPNLMPIRKLERLKRRAKVAEHLFNESNDDYLLRFKVPSNPQRIIVFGLLGIPIVSDFTPSALQFIQHGRDGLLAYSAAGWYRALLTLAGSPALRNKYSRNMKLIIDESCRFELQNERLLLFVQGVSTGPEKKVSARLDPPQDDLSSDLRIRFRTIVNPLVKMRFIRTLFSPRREN